MSAVIIRVEYGRIRCVRMNQYDPGYLQQEVITVYAEKPAESHWERVRDFFVAHQEPQ